MRRLCMTLALGLIATPALADPIGATKSVVVVSDPLGNLAPRAIPGAIADYTVTLSNPASNTGLPVRNMVFEDQLPASVILQVADLTGAGTGPVQFSNGAIVLGIGDSGLTYTFTSLASATDSIDFFDGTSWSYAPVPDAQGYDARVRAIRIKPLTTFKTGGSFSLRFRVKVR